MGYKKCLETSLKLNKYWIQLRYNIVFNVDYTYCPFACTNRYPRVKNTKLLSANFCLKIYFQHSSRIFLVSIIDEKLAPTSPDDNTLLRYSKKFSSLTSWSVKIKVIPCPWTPATLYKYFKSSIIFVAEYDLNESIQLSFIYKKTTCHSICYQISHVSHVLVLEKYT